MGGIWFGEGYYSGLHENGKENVNKCMATMATNTTIADTLDTALKYKTFPLFRGGN